MKYINLFETYNDYEDYVDGGLMSYPNVSYCIEEDELHYQKNAPTEYINIYYDGIEVQVDANQTLGEQGYSPAYDTDIIPYGGVAPTDFAYDYPQAGSYYYSYYDEEQPMFDCPNCGMPLEYEPDASNPCWNCNYPLLYSCPNCGAALEYEPDENNPCPMCGYPYNNDDTMD